MTGIRSHYFPRSIFISSVTGQAFLSVACSIIMLLNFTEEGPEIDVQHTQRMWYAAAPEPQPGSVGIRVTFQRPQACFSRSFYNLTTSCSTLPSPGISAKHEVRLTLLGFLPVTGEM